MKCTNEQIAGLLQDLVTGHLDKVETATVEKHLGECESCRIALATMNLLANKSGALVEEGGADHPSADLLSNYYSKRDSVEPTTVAEIERHLERCDGCSQDMEFLTSMERELRMSVEAQRGARSLFSHVLVVLREVLRKPALIYACASLLVLLGGTWVYRATTGGDGLVSERSSDIQILGEMRRAGGNLPLIHRFENEDVLRVDVPFYHLVAKKDYSFRLSRLGDGASVAAEVNSDFSDAGVIHLEIEVRDIPDAEYSLTLLESEKATPGDTSPQHFPFRLQTRR